MTALKSAISSGNFTNYLKSAAEASGLTSLTWEAPQDLSSVSVTIITPSPTLAPTADPTLTPSHEPTALADNKSDNKSAVALGVGLGVGLGLGVLLVILIILYFVRSTNSPSSNTVDSHVVPNDIQPAHVIVPYDDPDLDAKQQLGLDAVQCYAELTQSKAESENPSNAVIPVINAELPQNNAEQE